MKPRDLNLIARAALGAALIYVPEWSKDPDGLPRNLVPLLTVMAKVSGHDSRDPALVAALNVALRGDQAVSPPTVGRSRGTRSR